MLTLPQLKAARDSLLTTAGLSVTQNENRAGAWLDLTLACEELAGASSTAGTTLQGYMLRSAVAIESITGTTGNEENTNYEGLLKRLVDALEDGSEGTGSIGNRLVLSAAAFAGGEPAVLPGNITDLDAVATGNDVALTWTAAADADSHEYRINGAGSWVATGTNTGHTVEGLLYETEYDFEVRGVNGDGNGNASNVATDTTDAAPGLTAPDITVTSAPGDPPEVTIGLKADHFAGYFLRIQRNADGDVDGNGDYTDQTLEASSNGVLYFITADDLADGITNAELEAVGYADPTGVYFQQYRIENEIDQVSPWVEIDDTVVVSVAVLSNTNGTDKSQFVTVSGSPLLTCTCSADVGSANSARTVTAASGKRHFEVTIDSFNGSGAVIISLVDSAVALGASAFPTPGNGGNAGCSLILNAADSTINRNNGSEGGGGAWAVNDIAIWEFDTDTNFVSIKRRRSGVTSAITSFTLTTLIPTNWTAAIGGYRSGDGATINFGATAFAEAPSTDYLLYG